MLAIEVRTYVATIILAVTEHMSEIIYGGVKALAALLTANLTAYLH